MAGIQITMSGAAGIDAKLKAIMDAKLSIQRAAVSTGVSVLSSAVKSASKGTIKQEIGKWVRVAGGGVTGRAGMMRFPRRGVRGKQPHGIYLEHGTKHITAQHFVANSLNGAKSRAVSAMEMSVKKKIEQIANSN